MTAISILGSLPIVINAVSSYLHQNISQKPLRVMAMLVSPPKRCLAPWTDWLVPALILRSCSNLHSPSSPTMVQGLIPLNIYIYIPYQGSASLI